MRPKERRDSGQNDFFKARLDQIIDMDHALAKLGRAIDWRFLEERFGAVYSDKVGCRSTRHGPVSESSRTGRIPFRLSPRSRQAPGRSSVARGVGAARRVPPQAGCGLAISLPATRITSARTGSEPA